ncbi:unnamed protein product [Bursaphelenchus xylophilus]|uniref:(pine wood nematode) hypothetical protein n=1 Tax=Bursaphelenchus xylophilus TaxID=6326 RepID=A0A1I7SLB1_BURXY|nr:unnamed protein product [Bursaphelenchus xylophilus]CAG9129458.1 unnamed protein product [Bursaphelenchus xylophilus]
MKVQSACIILALTIVSSAGPPIEYALFQALAPNFQEEMEKKMEAHPELEKLAEEAEKNHIRKPFFLEHLDVFEKYMKEIFIENGNDPKLADFVIAILQLGADQGSSKAPITPEIRAKAQADFRKKWIGLDEASKNKIRQAVPTLAATMEKQQG